MLVWWLFVRSRFIEPQQIVVQNTVVDLWINTSVALIADMHLGVYKDRVYLQRVVNEINTAGPDMVVIAWDFVNHVLEEQSLDELFAPLADLKMPVYAVLWNHDVWVPWDDNRLELVQALEAHWVRFLNNDVVWVNQFYLVGLWSHLWGDDDISVLNKVSQDDVVVALMHNPDTTSKYTSWVVDLSLAGHTHCGQIRVPYLHEWLRPKIYPVSWDFDCWLTQEEHTKLYITSWLWEVILPFRFQAPPRIDILHL